MDEMKFSRRNSLGLLGLAGAAAAIPSAAAAATAAKGGHKAPLGKPRIPFITKIDFKDPLWTRDTYARIDADLDPAKEKCGWLKGKAYGVRDNEKVRPLFGVEGFSFVRTKRLEDGSVRRMLREIVFYRDLETGALADLGHVRQAFAGGPLEVLRGLVVLHRQEADALIAAELQRRDAGHVGLALDGLLGLRDRGVALEVLAREHERRGVAGLGRESLGEEVERLLGLRAWSAEGVDEGAAAGRGRRTEGDEDHGDDGEGALPMPRGRSGETSEYMGHAFQGITLRAKLQ